MCGVVQNVSRPTLSCQEMSHAPPITLQITATRQDQMYQEIDSVPAIAWTVVRSSESAHETLEELSVPWRFFREVPSTSIRTKLSEVAVYTSSDWEAPRAEDGSHHPCLWASSSRSRE